MQPNGRLLCFFGGKLVYAFYSVENEGYVGSKIQMLSASIHTHILMDI